jgi:hypothetical protein
MNVTNFPFKLMGKWMDGMYYHKLASLGGSSTNFCTLGAKSPYGGYVRGVKCNFSLLLYIMSITFYYYIYRLVRRCAKNMVWREIHVQWEMDVSDTEMEEVKLE